MVTAAAGIQVVTNRLFYWLHIESEILDPESILVGFEAEYSPVEGGLDLALYRENSLHRQ